MRLPVPLPVAAQEFIAPLKVGAQFIVFKLSAVCRILVERKLSYFKFKR